MAYLDELNPGNCTSVQTGASNQCGTAVMQKGEDLKRISFYVNANTAPMEHASEIFANGDRGLDGKRRYTRIRITLMEKIGKSETRQVSANLQPYEAEILYEAVRMSAIGFLPSPWEMPQDIKVIAVSETAGKCTSLVIRYNAVYNGRKSSYPWYTEITNAECTVDLSPGGTTQAVPGSVRNIQKQYANVRVNDMMKMLLAVHLNLESFAMETLPTARAAVRKISRMK